MSFEKYKYSVNKDPYEWCLKQSKRLEGIDPHMKIQMRINTLLTQVPGELEHASKSRGNNNGTLDDIETTLQEVSIKASIGRYYTKSTGDKRENTILETKEAHYPGE
ncbi:hypothetical protein O181_106093 [Austropuccinia psidii MF-1]|uniref:Uncharacterized protein n=1 Tax=Austropuccinia psidii MF-1 TaxID=1389203 RepID=A0A9Q3JNB2_9BASI|nr:hypothetical protein [Austropuccinia psidii MF-1]